MGSKAGQIERKWSLTGTDDAAAWEKRPVRFSLAALLRLLTMVALTLGWAALVGNGADGSTVFRTIVFLGCIFTLVIFFRVPGRPGHRVRISLLFGLGMVLVGIYSSAVAWFIQTSYVADAQGHNHPWAVLDQLWNLLCLLGVLPGVLVLVFLLFRTWVRAANEYRDAIRTVQRLEPDG
jgi:hypothetical protein